MNKKVKFLFIIHNKEEALKTLSMMSDYGIPFHFNDYITFNEDDKILLEINGVPNNRLHVETKKRITDKDICLDFSKMHENYIVINIKNNICIKDCESLYDDVHEVEDDINTSYYDIEKYFDVYYYTEKAKKYHKKSFGRINEAISKYIEKTDINITGRYEKQLNDTEKSYNILVHTQNSRFFTNFIPVYNIIKEKYPRVKIFASFDIDCIESPDMYENFLKYDDNFYKAPSKEYTIKYYNYDAQFIISPYIDDYYDSLKEMVEKYHVRSYYLDYGVTVTKNWSDFRKNFVYEEEADKFEKLINIVDYYFADIGDISFVKKYYNNIYLKNQDKFKLIHSLKNMDWQNYKDIPHTEKNVLISLRPPINDNDIKYEDNLTNQCNAFMGTAYPTVPKVLTFALEHPDYHFYFRLHGRNQELFEALIGDYEKLFKNIHIDLTEYDTKLNATYDVLGKMDMIICDYSTIIAEYTNYNIPIYCLDFVDKDYYYDEFAKCMTFDTLDNILDNFDEKFHSNIDKSAELTRRVVAADEDRSTFIGIV